MLPSAMDCMRRAAAQQFREEIIDLGYDLRSRQPVIGGIVGTATHKGSENSLHNYIKTGDYGKTNDCIEIGVNDLQLNIESGVLWDTTTTTKNEAEKQVIQMIKSFCIQIAPTIKPLSLPEKKLIALIGNDIIFSGQNDIETIEDNIHDIKTGVKEKSFQAQQGGYSLLRKAEQNKKTNKIIIDYLPRVSTKKIYPGAKQIEYNVDLCERMSFDMIIRIAEAVRKFREKGNCFAFPCNPMSMLCSSKYCPAHGTNFCKL